MTTSPYLSEPYRSLSPAPFPTPSPSPTPPQPTLLVLNDPTRSTASSSQPPPLPTYTPHPVSLPRLPPIPPLVVHQEQLYFDDGLGAPGKCPHERVWGGVNEHREERGAGLSDVEMDDFMVDLGELVSKEYDAWIERCWVEAFHHTYTTHLPSLLLSLIQLSCSPQFLRRSIINGGPALDNLLSQHFAHLLREEHEARMSDGDGGRRGVDWGNLLAGIREGVTLGAAGGEERGPNRLTIGGSGTNQLDSLHQQLPLSVPHPLNSTSSFSSATNFLTTSTSPSNPHRGPPLAGQQLPMPSSPKTDPARTGYGNGICFHDLALLHGRVSAVSQPVNPLSTTAEKGEEKKEGEGEAVAVAGGEDTKKENSEEEPADPQVTPSGPTGATSSPPAPPLPAGVKPLWTPGDDHAPCLCHLTACRTCFHELLYFRGRRVEVVPPGNAMTDAGAGGGGGNKRPSPLQIRHPEMSEILLVEEHLKTRLYYMGSKDVVLRYGTEGAYRRFGVGTGAGLAGQKETVEEEKKVEGEDEEVPWDDATFIPKLEEVLIAGPGSTGVSAANKALKDLPGKNGQSKVIPPSGGGGGKKGKGGKQKGGKAQLQKQIQQAGGGVVEGEEGPQVWEKRWNGCQLPKEWMDEQEGTRNMAVILTYRHFVKLLHQTAVSLSPFDFPDYADDSAVLTEIHPLAVYRRLVEPYVRRNAEISGVDVDKWKWCMGEWEKEVAVREKEGGNAILKTQPARAVAFYTQAICLDSENPVYYLNRAAAFNAIENYEDAELDCSRALSLNKTHMKAWYRRAVARKGMGRLDEAEADLMHLLQQAPNIAAATAELAAIRKEIEEMKRRDAVDDLD